MKGSLSVPSARDEKLVVSGTPQRPRNEVKSTYYSLSPLGKPFTEESHVDWSRKGPRRVLALALCFASDVALAATFKVASTGGLMQQPTSHYYHAIYGLAVEGGVESQKFVVRGSYLERPEFRNAGFRDKDYGYFLMAGTKITKTKDRGLYAYFGGGRMLGYVKADPDTAVEGDAKERDFGISGPSAVLEYVFRWKKLDLAANHQTFIGYGDKAQAEAYVAWPYNFFQVSAGIAW